MALKLDYDINTGIELKGMYFRVDRISFNDTHFQVVATGYSSEQAYKSGKMPVSEPRAYDLVNYNKEDISEVFSFAYDVLKQHNVFKNAEDVLDEGQEKKETLIKTKIVSGEHGLQQKGNDLVRNKIYDNQ